MCVGPSNLELLPGSYRRRKARKWVWKTFSVWSLSFVVNVAVTKLLTAVFRLSSHLKPTLWLHIRPESFTQIPSSFLHNGLPCLFNLLQRFIVFFWLSTDTTCNTSFGNTLGHTGCLFAICLHGVWLWWLSIKLMTWFSFTAAERARKPASERESERKERTGKKTARHLLCVLSSRLTVYRRVLAENGARVEVETGETMKHKNQKEKSENWLKPLF